ncbi:MAG: AmmeMemoRadiSam system radical SAM enzyme [Planctomycetota bacterium]
MRQATFFSFLANQQIRCELCPQACILSEGETGDCLVRTYQEGTLKTQIYGTFTAMALEPIEKKPLFHFLPGHRVLSVGSMGCTMNCDYCQNWPVSQKTEVPTRFFTPEALLQQVRLKKASAICFTYNEPLLMFEYLRDSLPLFQEEKIPVILKTSGYIAEEPLKALLPFINAVNLDLKGSDNGFYQRVCHRELAPVLETAKLLAKTPSIHLEISHLIVPQENDQEFLYHQLGHWIQRELGVQIPLHLGLFFPANRFQDKKPTPMAELEKAYRVFRSYLPFTYLSSSAYHLEGLQSLCPFCQNLLISRNFQYQIQVHLTAERACLQCHQSVPFVLSSF